MGTDKQLKITPATLRKALTNGEFFYFYQPIVSLGASDSKRPPIDNVERFLSMLRFDAKEKMNALGFHIDPEAGKIET